MWLGAFFHFNLRPRLTTKVDNLFKGQTAYPMKLYEEFLKATAIFLLVTVIQLSTWEIFKRIDREIDREWERAIE